ncbi:kiSS-1 receptor-like [Paramacrobiotus metropolitanus]|uniref:kiSS-1 receptor-like n=1 Tax=Paramacrobiotus metropolitanus TaxID=2943436 RepID=UPI002445E94B|nr:kiSS-1 receptor-like [Paramacrobiotus metropolitanus]
MTTNNYTEYLLTNRNHNAGLLLLPAKNITLSHPVGSSVSLISLTAATVLLNFGVLIILFVEKHLRTPFNVYIIVLLSSNILYVGLNNILMVLAPHGHWWIGGQACTLRIYCRYIVVTITIHSHVLISINRAWALFWPISYRHHHTTTVAWLLSLGMVMYVHVCQLPALILDGLYYRVSTEKDCRFNSKAQNAWATFSTVWVFDMPKVFILVCYPFLLWKFIHVRRRPVPADKRVADARRSMDLLKRRDTVVRPFVLLTMFTASAAVCWIPIMVYYILADLVASYKSDTLETALILLYSIQPVLDPVFFCLGVSNLHNYIVVFCQTKFGIRKLSTSNLRKTRSECEMDIQFIGKRNLSQG